jgi:hypothetical protein
VMFHFGCGFVCRGNGHLEVARQCQLLHHWR